MCGCCASERDRKASPRTWRPVLKRCIHSPDLIAYPFLPGEPGLFIGDDKRPLWHFDTESGTYARSLGEPLAGLRAVDAAETADTGIDVYTPTENRERIRSTGGGTGFPATGTGLPVSHRLSPS